MKIELIKKTERGTGKVWYHIQLNFIKVDGTFTSDEKTALESFENTKKLAKKYPVNTIEVVKTEDV